MDVAIDQIAQAMYEAVGKVGAISVYRALAECAVLHAEKNRGYGTNTDPFANFKENPVVTKQLMTPVQYAYVLMSKQDDALPRLVWTRTSDPTAYESRGGEPMMKERVMDGIVYRALILGLMEA